MLHSWLDPYLWFYCVFVDFWAVWLWITRSVIFGGFPESRRGETVKICSSSGVLSCIYFIFWKYACLKRSLCVRGVRVQFGGPVWKRFCFFKVLFIFFLSFKGSITEPLRAVKFLQRCAYFADLRGIYPKIEVRGCSCEESSQRMIFELKASRVALKIADVKRVCDFFSNCEENS